MEKSIYCLTKGSKNLAEKIMLIFENKDLRETVSKQNIIKAREYTWYHIVDELINIHGYIGKKL
jgi:hypothetical protein